MVVGGVPEKSNTHALNAANMAIDMVKRANEVKSPATNMPIQVDTTCIPRQGLGKMTCK